MKRKYLYIFLIIIIVLGIVFLVFANKPKKVYLSDKYYNNGEFIDINSTELEELKNDTYVLYIYNNFCAFSVPCENIFKEYMTKYKLDFISMKFEEFRNTKYYNNIKYAPSVIIIDKEKIKAYLNPSKDEDIDRYQNVKEFTAWINKYIYENK